MGGYSGYNELMIKGSTGPLEGILTVLLVLWSIYGCMSKSYKDSLLVDIDRGLFSIYVKIILIISSIITFSDGQKKAMVFLIGAFFFTFALLKLNSILHKFKKG